ncbi:MAG: sigma 54-interacting transcriptional regulator [Firmicutes bacterium]|nr:sigma 54-interacting transcriptional regulator [Bacillota bacterium]
MAKFAAIVPDSSLASTVTEVARELREDVVVFQAGTEEVLRAVRQAEALGVDAFLAKGFLAEPVRSITSLPVVACNPGPLDVVMAVAQAKSMGSRVALLHFGGPAVDLGALGAAMGIELAEFTPGRTPQEVRRTLEDIKRAGYEVAVSGQVTADMARSMGLKAATIGIGKVSVRQAMEACSELVKASVDAEERRLRYSEVLDGLPFGVVATDPKGIIRLCNRAAAALGAATPSQVGKPAAEALAGSPILATLRGEHSEGPRLAKIGEARVALEAVAWKSNGQNVGAVCVVHDVGYAERLVDRLSNPEETAPEVAPFTFDDIPATSSPMKQAVERARQYSMSDSPVVITGERGTGKEVLAQAIHNDSRRRSGAFGRVACAGLAPEALERRLFGLEKGAFPSARKSAPGVFEVCNGGTVFLDEVWALPVEIQDRIVAVLDHGSAWRIGGTEPRGVDARVIASSSRDLKNLVASGAFSEALYWRLAGMAIEVAPLRERGEDVAALFTGIARRLSPDSGDLALSPQAAARLRRHEWPGNVRELEGLVRRLVAALRSMPLVPADAVERMVLDDIAAARGKPAPVSSLTVQAGTLDEMVQSLIDQFDHAYGGNRSEVARRLGISRTTLWKKMKEQ